MRPIQTIETEGDGIESFFLWIQRNTRLLGIGVALIVVAALGFWFYLRSAEIKRLNAERGLNQAKQSMAAGNTALAQTDLDRVSSRYPGTPAGAQAAMILAQLHYDAGRFAEGVQALRAYETRAAARENLAAIWSLIADGHFGQDNAAEAAAAYRKAAEATPHAGASSLYLAKAARAFMAAGNDGEAQALWESLLKDPDAIAVHNEATMRLGELTAKPAGQS